MCITRKTFCGTWYLPHSQVHRHNDRTEPIIKVILHIFIVHAVHEMATENVKKTFIKTVIGDIVAHLKPQKFTVLSDF